MNFRKSLHENMRIGTYYRAEMLKLLNIKADKKNVLDVGCFDAYWLSTQSAENKYALDVNVDKKYKGINYLATSIFNNPFREGEFDQVFAFDVIEHIPKDTEEQFLSELIRIAKRKSEIIITVPSRDIKVFPSFLTNWVSRKWGHLKYNGLAEKELKSYLEKFNVEYKIIENNASCYLKYYLFIRLLWKLYQDFTKKIIRAIARKDFENLGGNNGCYIVKIIKK